MPVLGSGTTYLQKSCRLLKIGHPHGLGHGSFGVAMQE